MSRFVLKTLLFFMIMVVLTEGANLVAAWVLRRIEPFVLPEERPCLILGHSHPECAFDDALIPPCINLAFSGESYFYTYLKAKHVLRHKRQIKTVLIGFSNNQILAGMDLWIWGDDYLSSRYPSYSALMDGQDVFLLVLHNWKGVVQPRIRIAINNLLFIVRKAAGIESDCLVGDNLGGYYQLERQLDESTGAAAPSPNPLPDTGTLSETNLRYLDKMIELFRKHDITVYLIRSPVHARYYALMNEPVYRSIRDRRYGNVPMLDFKDYPLFASEFGDYGHLNTQGAREFSRFFNGLIESGLFEWKEPQVEIDREIAKRRRQRMPSMDTGPGR